MKKRASGIISLVLALVLLISLSACGNQNFGQTSEAETTSSETAALEETDAPETETVSSVPENLEIFDFELTDGEMEQIRALDKGEEGRYFNINYEQMGGFFTSLNE